MTLRGHYFNLTKQQKVLTNSVLVLVYFIQTSKQQLQYECKDLSSANEIEAPRKEQREVRSKEVLQSQRQKRTLRISFD
jgi:hypothetical protein